MPNDERESLLEQFPPRRDAMPRRRARWMRQGNEIELLSGARAAKMAPDDLIKFSDRHELRDGQFPDRDNESRLQDFDLTIQP